MKSMNKNSTEVIETLQGQVSTLHEHLGNLELKVEIQEQYSKIKCILIHGINENKDEKSDDLVLEIFITDMIINVKLE